jgi:hypothetical protein
MRRVPGKDEAHHWPAKMPLFVRHIATMVRAYEKNLI